MLGNVVMPFFIDVCFEVTWGLRPVSGARSRGHMGLLRFVGTLGFEVDFGS